ncbi:MAG: alpha-amylase family glycosyl hydrolase, partial [Mycobacteriales bacterium]
ASAPGSAERRRYHFRPGRGDGSLPPNDWPSVFGGPAWTRVVEPDGTPGEWYLHLFAREQPDFNWDSPDVRQDFEDTLRFWFDRGVDGFRIDVANCLIKEGGLPDIAGRAYPEVGDLGSSGGRVEWLAHPYVDRDEVHEVYRSWRRLADSYDPPRVFVAEAWLYWPERLAMYVRQDELHSAFNFDYLRAPWLAASLRDVIEETLAEHALVGAPPTWVLSNHDVVRHVSRYARTQSPSSMQKVDELIGQPADLDLGLRRTRAATLLTLALPGGAYVYQGEELGLAEVEDLPDDLRQDPTWERSEHTERGRDGCRVPIPWSGSEPPFGFSPDDAPAAPWLPQPAEWKSQTVEALTADPGSILELYRSALRIRREHAALGDGTLTWHDTPEGSLAFGREPGFACLVNVSAEALPLPAGADVLLASGPLTADRLVPSDTAVWLQASPTPPKPG